MHSMAILSAVANQLRIHSVASTTTAGSGHPTSCCSCAEIMAALFFGVMRYDPHHPQYYNNDRFILSKGHAAPILYAAWAENGFLTPEELLHLRSSTSDLEGHPTPRIPFVDVATGSLGQGLSCGVGMAISARLDRLDFRTYVLLGDGECSEGSVWEAASQAAILGLTNLVVIVDVNRLGQSQPTPFGHHVEVYRDRFAAFGWRTRMIDGHDMSQVVQALETVGQGTQPLAILARTIKGQGLEMADQEGWHGKVLSREEADRAIATLRPLARTGRDLPIPSPNHLPLERGPVVDSATTVFSRQLPYKPGDKIATRQAYGDALVRLGQMDSRIIALDGDVKNSTYSELFARTFPDRFVECFIAEQNMVSIAAGLSARGRIPFLSTFAAFWTRAHDQIRMAAMSLAELKICGSHCGVSVGEDGPSQMGLEDLAVMRAIPGSVVLYPCDAVSTERLVETMLITPGMVYLRTSRPKRPLLYNETETFPVGGAKVLVETDRDRVTIVAAGVTVFEALGAADQLAREDVFVTVIDAYSVKPLATDLLRDYARKTNGLVLTVEDHYSDGGLGDAVAAALSPAGIRVNKLAVRRLPHSGRPSELLTLHKIDSRAIMGAVRRLISNALPPTPEELSQPTTPQAVRAE